MRLKCPSCNEVVNRVRGSYIITATSDLRFTCDRDMIEPAVAPLEIVERAIVIQQVACPACSVIGQLDDWTVVLQCPGCGSHLAEFQAGANIPASQWYCTKEGNFLCRSCATRYSACDACSERSHCPIINEEV